MQKKRTTSVVVDDLKQLWFDLKWVYPMALNKIFSRWGVSLLCIFLIVSSFYLDTAFRGLFSGIHNSFYDAIFNFGWWFGNGEPTLYMFILFYAAGLGLSKPRLRDTGLLIGESYIFSGLLTLIFKSALGRWRPYTGHGAYAFDGWHFTGNDYFSYFSGHTQAAFAISVVLASTTNNVYLRSFYYLLGVITGFSRIYHDQHWLSDVVTGAVVAVWIGRQLVVQRDLRFGN